MGFKTLVQKAVGLLVVSLVFVVYAWLINPEIWSLYAYTLHGFLFGAICFLFGYMVVAVGEAFWVAAEKLCFPLLSVAFGLYLVRLFVFTFNDVPALATIIAFESSLWILGILGAGSKFFNKPSQKLSYLSKAVYPVYIVHMPIQFAICFLIIPTALPVALKFFITLVGTFVSSWLVYELILKRLQWVRPFFGIKF